jgi:4-methylaminobutanoate oxidase (formaldehyde-forming)
MAGALPSHAEIVVIGGGIIGCSTAYHLARLGKRDVVVLERSKLGSGTTWHSAAMVRQLRSTNSLTQLVRYSAELYQELEAETGQATGWMSCGSLSIATNPDRLTHIRRQASLARGVGIEAHEIDREKIAELWPIAETSDIIAGILSPSDGRVSPLDTLAALSKGARSNGVRFFEHTPATGFESCNGRITAVRTADRTITCDKVVMCAGLWSQQLGRLAGVAAPLHACEHYALIVKPFDGIYNAMPILGDHDNHMYIRDEAGGLMVGCFEPRATPVRLADLPPGFSFDLLPENWERFEPVMQGALRRIPALETAEVRMLLNGPESFTLDNSFMMGEAPELAGFYLCCGMNSVGMASGGGGGRAIAEWVIEGEPTMDLWSVDVRRFAGVRNNLRLLGERAAENLSAHYDIGYPGRTFATGRNLRLTPLHQELCSQGAHFVERSGWERAAWFNRGESTIEPELTFERPQWFDRVADEHWAARENMAIFDQSTLGKLLVQGDDAEAFLQRVCANDVAVQVGRLRYTPILNRRGGYESDVVVMRLAHDMFQLTTGTAQPLRDLHLLTRSRRAGEFVTITDVTSGFAVLSVAGPNTRELLKRVSPDDFANDAFPFQSHRTIEIGGTVARAARLSYTGELGWEIYVAADAALPLYRALMAEGRQMGIANAGAFALEGLRIEKGFCAWGHDVGPDDTPLEAGLGFATKLDTGIDFIGREALTRQKAEGLKRRRVNVRMRDSWPQLLGTEPILLDGEYVGQIFSAGYGHTLCCAVGIGFVRLAGPALSQAVSSVGWEVEIALKRYPIEVSLKGFYDPRSERPRLGSGRLAVNGVSHSKSA